MKRKNGFPAAGVLAALAVLFTVLVSRVDVRAIGPLGSSVGFAGVNGFVRNLIGERPAWYRITEAAGCLPMLTAPLFASVGLVQLIRRRSLRRVEPTLYALAGLYVLMTAVYAFFEFFPVNFRPVLEDGVLKASYPSSHTMQMLILTASSVLESRYLLKNGRILRIIRLAASALGLFIIVGRAISGVHWCTDIAGGLLFGAALTALYAASAEKLSAKYGKKTEE